jgi:hypothetical protein
MKILLLQLFWASFALIGFSILLFCSKNRRFNKNIFLNFLFKTHPLVFITACLVTGIASFVVVIAPAMFFELKIWVVFIAYVAALAGSIAALFQYKRTRKSIHLDWSYKGYLYAALVVLMLDFVLSLLVGGQLDGDAKFELARIQLYANARLGLSDAVFGENGIPVTIYSTSTLHALQAVASKLLDVSVAWVWFYSHAFYRLIIWLSFFSLTWSILSKTVYRKWAYIVLLLLPLMHGGVFMEPELHNRIVLAWTAIFITGVKLWLERKGAFLLVVGSVLIATSHPLNAVMAAGFLALVSVVLALAKLLTKQELTTILPILLLLITPIGFYYYYPHGITDAGFYDSPSSGSGISLQQIGPFWIADARVPLSFLIIGVYIVLLGYLVLASRITKTKQRLLVYGLVISGVVLVYDPLMLSLLGYGYMIYISKNKRTKITLLLLITYLALVMYNPVLLTLGHDTVPLWAISRFQDFNVLAYVAPIIGLLCIAVLPLEKWKYHRLAGYACIGTAMVLVFIVPLTYPLKIQHLSASFGDRAGKRERLDTLENIGSFEKQLRDQVVLSDDPVLSAIIPGAVVANVLSIENEANTHPAVHIKQRKLCAQILIEKMQPNDLQASGVTAIITRSLPGSNFINLLEDRADIRLVEQARGFRIYKVRSNSAEKSQGSYSVCSIPPTQKYINQ